MKYILSPIILCVALSICHQSNGALFSWGGGGQPTTAEPSPCGIGMVPINEEQNGTMEASAGQIVWEMSVMTKNMGATWGHTCGGALITKQAVLTSASCVDGLNAGFVRVHGATVDLPKGGFVRRRRMSYPGQQITGMSYTEKIVTHPEYNKITGENNLAVLRLATALDFTKAEGKLNAICYPEEPLAAGDPGQLFVSGWGKIHVASQVRAKLQLKPIEKIDCPFFSNVNEFCATQEGQCEGDMGGPVFTSNELNLYSQLIGITSRGKTCSPDDPMIYTEVQPYLAWIKDAAKPYY